MKKPKKIKIVQEKDKPEVPAEVIAQSLVEISNAARHLANGRLKRDAIVTLIKDKTGIPKTTINTIMDNIESLKTDWLR